MRRKILSEHQVSTKYKFDFKNGSRKFVDIQGSQSGAITFNHDQSELTPRNIIQSATQVT